MKRFVWAVLARFLSWGARAIRRQPSRLGPDEWRAVRFSYSHYAEDLIVLHLFRDKVRRGEPGVYVDVGAFDPVLFSNTLLLHQHGWRGVNVDPNEAQIEKFRRFRPADANLHAIVSGGRGRSSTWNTRPAGPTGWSIRPRPGWRTSSASPPPGACR